MCPCPDNSLFSTLAVLFSGLKVDSAALANALELLCTNFTFECGLIYEVDFSNQLCMVEHYSTCPVPLEKVISAEKLTKQEQQDLLCNEILFVEEREENTPVETRILTLHHAKSLVLAPVADAESHICGLVMLLGITRPISLREEERETLSALLSMLVHYAGTRMYQKRITQSQLISENILDNTGIDIYVNDFYNHDILFINKSMAAPYGGVEMFSGHKCWQVLFPGRSGPCDFCPKDKLLDAHGAPKGVYVWDYQRAFDGAWFRVFSSAFYWADGRLAHVVSSADITDNKRNEAMIENLANYDQLTQLPNRRMLLQECERSIGNADIAEQGYLLFFDIDGFKEINDSFGHDAGDEFLIALGQFFSSIPLLKNGIYRNGGDEFVALIGGDSITKEHIQSLASFIHQRFTKPWKLSKGEVFCSTSIGVACFPEDGVTAEALLQKADAAMYKVKKSGGGAICFGYQLNQ